MGVFLYNAVFVTTSTKIVLEENLTKVVTHLNGKTAAKTAPSSRVKRLLPFFEKNGCNILRHITKDVFRIIFDSFYAHLASTLVNCGHTVCYETEISSKI
jgi:hypothetical protein